MIKEKDQQIEGLKKQLSEAKNRRPAVSSTALAGSNSSAALALVEGGLSVTDVYNEMLLAQEQLAEERDKCNNHEKALERITAELQVKVPMMLRQKREQEEAFKSVQEMSLRLETAEDYARTSKVRLDGERSDDRILLQHNN